MYPFPKTKIRKLVLHCNL